jgi:hypothetical protein
MVTGKHFHIRNTQRLSKFVTVTMNFLPPTVITITTVIIVTCDSYPKKNSVTFNPQANYTARATAACRRS